MGLANESYEARLGKKEVPVKEVYKCPVCQIIVIRKRIPGSKPYVKWCCGNKMTKVSNKCSICKKHIKGANHFQGKHHLAAVTALRATKAAEVTFGTGMKGAK